MAIYKRFFFLFSVVSFALCLSGCGSVEVDPSADSFVGRQMWTATNLRVFGKRNKIRMFDKRLIYWQNYLSGWLLPAGTAIRFSKIDSEKAIFVDNENYPYTFFWRGRGDSYKDIFDQEVHKYFTFTNPTPQIEKLSEEEKQSWKLGDIKVGMTKQTVLLTWGHPPGILEPLKVNVWSYWDDRSCEKSLIVYFNENKVVHISK